MKVLIVDDQNPGGYMAQLRRAGVEFEHVQYKEEWREIFPARINEFDTVLMDGKLGWYADDATKDDMSGKDLVLELRKAGYLKPIIACSSAHAYNHDMIEAGANEAAQHDLISQQVVRLLSSI